MVAIRYVYALALGIWLGGMVVLGAVVAPATFQVLQARASESGREMAGAVFATVLARFHYVAYAAGGLLLATLLIMAVVGPRPRGFAFRLLIAAAMLSTALYSGVVVLGRVDRLQREIGGLPSRLQADDPRRIEFDRLHLLSTRLMLLNLAGTLVLLYWEARE
jgi:hypothetical protein